MTGRYHSVKCFCHNCGHLCNFALHFFAVVVVNVRDDARDSGTHFLDGAHVSAVGGACGSSKGRRLRFSL